VENVKRLLEWISAAVNDAFSSFAKLLGATIDENLLLRQVTDM